MRVFEYIEARRSRYHQTQMSTPQPPSNRRTRLNASRGGKTTLPSPPRCHYGRLKRIPPRTRRSLSSVSLESGILSMSQFLESIALPASVNEVNVSTDVNNEHLEKIQGVVDALKCAMECTICRGVMEKPFV